MFLYTIRIIKTIKQRLCMTNRVFVTGIKIKNWFNNQNTTDFEWGKKYRIQRGI